MVHILLYPSSHWQSPDELIEMAHKYYADTALPKLVSFQMISFFILFCLSDVKVLICLIAGPLVTRSQILAPLNFRLLMEGH